MNYATWLTALIIVTAALAMLSEASPGLATILALVILAGVFYREMPALRARFNF